MWTFNSNLSMNFVPPVNDFNPVHLNTDSWLYAASLFNAKYAVLTAKHDSGFCLFPTKYPGYTYSVAHTKWGNGQRDIVQEFIQSCKSLYPLHSIAIYSLHKGKKFNILPAFYYSFDNNFYQGVQNGLVSTNNTDDQKRYNDLCLFQ